MRLMGLALSVASKKAWDLSREGRVANSLLEGPREAENRIIITEPGRGGPVTGAAAYDNMNVCAYKYKMR